MMPRVPPKNARLAELSKEQKDELDRIERETIINFSGQIDDLEKAIGMLRMGHHWGWRVLVLVHSKRTVRKFEKILGITFREFFPETGPSTRRSYGYVAAEKLSNFWKAVSGEETLEDRSLVDKEPIKGT